MSGQAGKKLYSFSELYRILYECLRTYPSFFKAKKSGGLNTPFVERLMLAVTEVNHCPLCSYGHTRIALEAGMSQEEIRQLLAGSTDAVPDDEIAAVLFAQHYADSRGRPSKKAWRQITALYGAPKAEGILGAIRMIMFGNCAGIVLNSFAGRWKGRPDPRSSLLYELGMMAAWILFFPAALIQAVFASLLRRPLLY